MSLEPGSILHNRYRIEAQLGRGGMGAVYRAYDQTLQIEVALKENLNTNPESERQFQREANLLASLRHPHLPRVTDHFVLEGRQYLVMDFIQGTDLHARALEKPPSVSEVLDWADSLCDALSYLHNLQPPIIHRDIKPANVKLQPDGTVVLVDFGLAKVFDQVQTSTGARGLTPGYSPPEQYGGARTDARSDQYALAATLYSLLTGKSPTDSIERMLDKVDLKPARALNPLIPAHVDAALTRALSIEQASRFPEVQSFRMALSGKLDAATIRAAAPAGKLDAATIRAAAPAEAKRRAFPWIPIVAVGAVLLVLIGGGAAFGLGRLFFAAAAVVSSTPTSPPTAVAATGTPIPVVAVQPSPTQAATLAPSLSPTSHPTSPPAAAAQLGGGGRIAFVSNREDGQTLQIWTMNPDGSDPRQVTFGPGDKTEPRWSPDGLRMLYVAPGGKDSFGNDFGLDLWSINADGTGVTDVTAAPGDDTNPAWSPDGKFVAFTGTRVAGMRQVLVMGIACSSPPGGCSGDKPVNYSLTPNFNPVEYSPAWSPDGKRIAVAASINGAPGKIFFHPANLPAGGTPAPTPSAFDRSDTIVGVDHLRWSPDGQYLLFTWVQPKSNEVYLVDVTNPTRWIKLTNTSGNKEPAFSPDGQYIVFTSTRDQNPEIYLMPVNGANQTNLTKSPTTRDIEPDWQPKVGN